ncbi:MAG: hypothetical protein GY809_09570 [Planctomycetes bacterium]|nr:hypothetical protein [Planctomycetota bacterium]
MNYRHEVQRFLKADVSPVAFKAYRVPMGIYEQRESGRYMVRVRLGAGLITPDQLAHVAGLSREYGDGSLHLTTRQDVQIHALAIEDTPKVLEALLDVGLSSRGGGGNTVRNVSVGPYAGVGPDEVFDVTPHAIAVSEYLLQDRSAFCLPRKFKIAFSGTPKDEAFASVTDLGFFAQIKDGHKGFAVYAAGGMGGSSNVGIEIEPFVPEAQIFLVAETLKRVFEAEGDRVNRRKARLRFVLARLGEEAFVQCYHAHKQAVLTQGLRGDAPELRPVFPVLPPLDVPRDAIETSLEIQAESTPGYYTVRLQLPLGDASARDMSDIANASRQAGVGLLRVTQGQDLLLLSVPHTQLGSVEQAVGALSVPLQNGLPLIAACAGAATCKLGLCRSRGLAVAVAGVLEDRRGHETGPLQVVRISGCPNGCAQHLLADLGFQGRAKRVEDRLMPYYDVFAGSRLEQGGSRLAQRIGSLPAKRVPDFVQAVYAQDLSTIEALKNCAAQHAVLKAGQIPEDYFVDFEACRPFSLEGLGAGECSAGIMDIVNADMQQAQDALNHKTGDRADCLSRAALAAARALLVLFGVEANVSQDIAQGFKAHLVDPGWVDPQTHRIVQQASSGSLEDDAVSRASVQSLLERIVALHGSLDGQLRFTLAPVAPPAKGPEVAAAQVVDLRGVACPLNFVKAKLALERVEVGDEVMFLLDLGEAQKNVPDSFRQQGQEVIMINQLEDHVSLEMKRQK